jgi:hypothetical protein
VNAQKTGRKDGHLVIIAAVAVAAIVIVAGLSAYLFYLQPKPMSHNLTAYGRVTDVNYQGTSVSMVFVSNTEISMYSSAISYTANNFANSGQFYQRNQTSLGPQPVYTLSKGDNITFSYDDFPASSNLLNIEIQVNATIGGHTTLLDYEIAKLDTNST